MTNSEYFNLSDLFLCIMKSAVFFQKENMTIIGGGVNKTIYIFLVVYRQKLSVILTLKKRRKEHIIKTLIPSTFIL